jgi:large subunit ribosomal protein L9
MKVVFLQDVPLTARVGEIKEVKNGYARNFLLPRGMALPATKAYMEKAQAAARAEERRQASLDEDARTLAARIGTEPLRLQARVGETGRLYGSVTAQDIAEGLSQRAGREVDRHIVQLGEPIRQVGEYTVHVRLTRNVAADIPVIVEGLAEEQTER